MTLDAARTPTAFLRHMLGDSAVSSDLSDYEAWWEDDGRRTSEAIDRMGTPELRMFDRFGRRIDEIVYPPAYWQMLRRGYQAGAVWRAFEARSLVPSYLLGYVTSYYDPGLYCPYTVSLATALPLSKYGSDVVKERFLAPLLRRDATVWQGATWMDGGEGRLGSRRGGRNRRGFRR